MKRHAAALLIAIGLFGSAVFSMPGVANALGLSFGGRVTVITPCLSPLGPSIWITIVPVPATKQLFYIWTPATLTFLAGPPTHPGQQVLGVADIPYACAIPYPPWVLVGQRIQILGTSPTV